MDKHTVHVDILGVSEHVVRAAAILEHFQATFNFELNWAQTEQMNGTRNSLLHVEAEWIGLSNSNQVICLFSFWKSNCFRITRNAEFSLNQTFFSAWIGIELFPLIRLNGNQKQKVKRKAGKIKWNNNNSYICDILQLKHNCTRWSDRERDRQREWEKWDVHIPNSKRN